MQKASLKVTPSQVAGRFAILRIADKALPGAGGQGEIGLRQAKGFALFPDELAYFFWSHIHRYCLSLFPIGNTYSNPPLTRISPFRASDVPLPEFTTTHDCMNSCAD